METVCVCWRLYLIQSKWLLYQRRKTVKFVLIIILGFFFVSQQLYLITHSPHKEQWWAILWQYMGTVLWTGLSIWKAEYFKKLQTFLVLLICMIWEVICLKKKKFSTGFKQYIPVDIFPFWRVSKSFLPFLFVISTTMKAKSEAAITDL